MIFKRCAVIFGLTSLLLLSGCAKMYLPTGSKDFKVQSPSMRRAKLTVVKAWRIDGSLSIEKVGKKPVIANFTWHQLNPRDYRIEISSPLGLYSASIYSQYGSVELWKNGVHVTTAKSPRKLMQKALGWWIPITQMRDWIKGMPAPVKKAGYYQARYDKYGHLTFLKQQGWTIYYSIYRKDDYGMDFPLLITMRRPGFNIKIIIQHWQLLTQHEPMLDAIT